MKKQKSKNKSTKKPSKNKQVIKSEKKRPNQSQKKKSLQPVACLNTQLVFQFKQAKVFMHNIYEIKQNHKLFPELKNLIALYQNKQTKKQLQLFNLSNFTYFPSFQFELLGQRPSDNKCSICQFEFEEIKDYEKQLMLQIDEDIISLKCSHLLHLGCLKMLIGDKNWLKCPVCATIYGNIIGDQPSGTMSTVVQKDMHCDGYEDVGTIVINYHMKSGTTRDISFPSTSRTAYLPDNKEGNQVLILLKQAFNRKLIFTVGRSVTTGRQNQIVWNGIHHKTNTSGGAAYFGYPDSTYFDRIKLELAAKGIS